MLLRNLTIAALLLSVAPVAALELSLRNEARPAGPIVRLGDVAVVRDASPAERARLERLMLMPTPAPGTTQHLTASVLRDLLDGQGVSLDWHQIVGAEQTSITKRPLAAESISGDWRSANSPVSDTSRATAKTPFTDARPVSRRDSVGFVMPRTPRKTITREPVLRSSDVRGVESRVNESIQQLLDEHAGSAPLAVKDLEISAQTVRDLYAFRNQNLIADFDTAGLPTPGKARFLVRPESRDPLDAYLVVVDLAERSFRVVATESLNRGDLITASSVRLEPESLNAVQRGPEPYRTIEAAIGKEASRSIRTGQALTASNTAGRVMVHRDETVTVISGGGGIRVRLTAIARADGRLGDLVTVDSADRDEPFDARVVGPRKLAVLSAGGVGDRLSLLTQEGGLQ